MSITDRLDQIMQERGLNKAELAKGAGLPYMTVANLWKKGAENIKLSTMRKLADYLNITLDELVGEPALSDSSRPESEEEILTLAAHKVGHEGALTKEQIDQIKLAMKIALARENQK